MEFRARFLLRFLGVVVLAALVEGFGGLGRWDLFGVTILVRWGVGFGGIEGVVGPVGIVMCRDVLSRVTRNPVLAGRLLAWPGFVACVLLLAGVFVGQMSEHCPDLLRLKVSVVRRLYCPRSKRDRSAVKRCACMMHRVDVCANRPDSPNSHRTG